jgi:hypothetical protein
VIVFFVTREASSTLTKFFGTWGSRLAPKVDLRHYEELAELDELPAAASYVFTDLERLTPAGLRLSSELADMLADTQARVVNHPGRALRRHELLCTLHERGVNPFRAHRALPVPGDLRFPVFLRSEHEHEVLTPLLRSRREVERALIRAHAQGFDLVALLLVEYQDVADDDGMFHRHISHVIGDRVVPGYLAFSSSWVVKGGPFLEGERLARQRASVVSREHEPFLLEIAQLAGVGYGRFDYAVVDGRVYVWELNTNPTLLLTPQAHRSTVLEEVSPLAERLTEAIGRLAGETETQRPPVRVRLPGGELVARRPRQRRKRPVRVMLRYAEPLVTPILWSTRRHAILEAGARRAASAQASPALREP